MKLIEQLAAAEGVAVRGACAALQVARATFYRLRKGEDRGSAAGERGVRQDKPTWSCGCKSHTGKAEQATLAPSHAQAVARSEAKRSTGVRAGPVFSREITYSGMPISGPAADEGRLNDVGRDLG